jgi:hypothetical protein
VAVGNSGALAVSTDPAAGVWATSTIDSGHQLNAVACPSISLCVAADAAGHVVSSTDPAGAPSSWVPALVQGDPCSDSTPCNAEQIQTADRTGVHTADSSRTPGTTPALTGLTLSGDTVRWSHGGSPRSATLHP